MKKHDRRLAPRLTTNNSGTVMVLQHLIMSYSLLDVSVKGLGFSYSIDSGHINWIGEEREIELFGEGFIITKIPVRIVSDRPFGYIEPDEPFNEEKRHLRRCGVQFSPLAFNQKHQIDSYVTSLDIVSSLES